MTEPKEDRSLNLRRKTVVTVISKIGDRKPQADACLVCIYGQAIGRMFRLKRGEILIGRSSQATIQIDHESVSRRHALLKLGETQATLEDCGSTNGTYVNDEPIQQRVLRDGDFIKVGRTILKYLANNNIESAYHEEIYRLTTIDGLTRCYNRRYLREQLVREVSRAVRYERPLSLVMFDIDGFKQINDEYGHLAGDAVLTQMGKRISRRIRREDVIARFHGGQFALVAPEIDKPDAVLLADRIKTMVAEGAFGFDDVQIPVSISISVVGVGDIDEDNLPDSVFSENHTSPGELTSHPISFDNPTTEIGRDENDRFVLFSEAMLHVARVRLASAKQQGPGSIASES